MNKLTKEDKWMLDVPCCICEESCKDSQHINHYQTRYIPTWEYPSHSNLLIPNYGERALAQVCDNCIDNKTIDPIKYCVEYKDKKVLRHYVEGLNSVPFQIILQYEFSADTGNPWCICSACHVHIPDGQAPVRIWAGENENWEMVFCEKHTIDDMEEFTEWFSVAIRTIKMEEFLANKSKLLAKWERSHHQQFIKAKMGHSIRHMTN